MNVNLLAACLEDPANGGVFIASNLFKTMWGLLPLIPVFQYLGYVLGNLSPKPLNPKLRRKQTAEADPKAGRRFSWGSLKGRTCQPLLFRRCHWNQDILALVGISPSPEA